MADLKLSPEYPELQSCKICPRNCGVDRDKTPGFCGAGTRLKVNLTTLHHGEEPCLSGTRGSGTIFFAWCNLRCVFCQNYCLSVEGWGEEKSEGELAELMLALQSRGAHNINLVTPTHFSPQIVNALQAAKQQGLNIPIVWNSSAYEKPETLKRLAGLVDIYLPDFKYGHGIYAGKYSHAKDYPDIALAAIQEMFSQVGLLSLDPDGIATKGLLIRILVLPKGLGGSKKVLSLLADSLGTEITLSIMGQYYPAGKALDYPELSQGITPAEYAEVLETANQLGFEHLYIQELSSSADWTPLFRPKANTLADDFNPSDNPSPENISHA